MKKHWLSIIGYSFGILLLWAWIVIFHQPFLFMLLFLLLLLPVLSIWIFLTNISKIRLNAYSKVPSVETGHTIPIIVEGKNTSHFSFFHCEVRFTIENLYRPDSVEHRLAIPLLARRTNPIQIPVETAASGMICMQITSLCISDYLSFITKEIPLSVQVAVPVLPPVTDVILPSTAPVADGSEEFTESDNKGNLSSDIKEIREYRPGDRLQRIHWKLSAKLDELLVKEMAHTTVLSLIILPECNKETIEDTSILLRSVLESLLKKDERFEVCLYHHGACEFSYFLITDDSEITECMIHFFYQPLYEGTTIARDAYFASSQKAATILHICGTELKRLDSETIIG